MAIEITPVEVLVLKKVTLIHHALAQSFQDESARKEKEMKQIFGYTAPEVNPGETYVKFLAVYEVGDAYQVQLRNGQSVFTTLMVPKKDMEALAEAISPLRTKLTEVEGRLEVWGLEFVGLQNQLADAGTIISDLRSLRGAWALSEDQYDGVRQMLINAYEQGCKDAHEHHQEDRDPDFTESAMDYTSSVTYEFLKLFPSVPAPSIRLSEQQILERIAFNLCSLHDFDPDFVASQERFAKAVITEYRASLQTIGDKT